MENASNNAIVLDHGSHFEINNTNIVNSINNGNQPIVGIRDLGAQFISGDNNNIYASTCITGDIFNKEEIITITDDTISAVNNDFSIVTTSNEDEFILDIKDYFNKFYYNCL